MLNVEVASSLARGGDTLFVIDGRDITGYTHTIDSFGGFISAQISLGANQADLMRWIPRSVGLVIRVIDGPGSVVWQGFLNSLTINTGGRMYTVTPFMDISNRVRVAYSTLYFNTNPPVGGDPVATTWADDLDSQNKYGILSTELNGGETVDAEADRARDMYLAVYANPHGQVFPADSQEDGITLECLGDINYLDRFVYEQVAGSSQDSITTKLSQVVGAEPNGFIQVLGGDIANNTFLVTDYEASGKTGLSICKELVSYGDSQDNRYLFGVYEDQRAIYQRAPEAIEYIVSSASPGIIFSRAGVAVDPARARPGKYILDGDLMPGSEPTDLESDPRVTFIESVTFNAPDRLSWNGSRLLRLNQRLARLGISGGVT